MRARTLLIAASLFACGGGASSGPGVVAPDPASADGGTSADGGVIVGPDGGVVVSPDGGPVVIPQTDPQIRFVAVPQNETVRIDPKTLQQTTVLLKTYAGLTRTRDETFWDLFDPITGRYIAQFDGNGGQFLWSVNNDTPQKVAFDGASPIFQSPIAWAVMTADAQRIYLSTTGGAYLATRKSQKLEFSAPVALGQGVKIVHDVSRDNGRVAVSGHRATKWTPGDTSAPRMVSVFALKADGTFGTDKTSDYPPLASNYIEEPIFLADSTTLLYEGDDDIDTGDRLWITRAGGQETEIFPQMLSAQDFNTPCALPDDRILFWESDAHRYTLRMFDMKANTTVTVRTPAQAGTNYVRCR